MNRDKYELIKQEFAHLDSVYFNTAYFGPSPYRAKQKVSRALQKELDPSFHEYNKWIGVAERLRIQLADLLGCNVDNITHQCSVSDVNNVIANGYHFQKGDYVCALNGDYPSDVLPWMLKDKNSDEMSFKLLDLGGEVVPTPEFLEKNLPPRTRIFCISWVTFDTGKKIDLLSLGRWLKEKEILFVVDGTQALGGLKLSKEELEVIDVFACACYKWLLGPYGTAFAYFSDRALKLVHHTTANWVTSPKSKVVYDLLDYTTETLPGARKYDRGQTSNMLANSCLEASLELFSELDMREIQKHNEVLRDHFLDHYPADKFDLITPTSHMGSILCLRGKNLDPIKLERELKFRNIDVSVRQGNIRLSFHLFNTVEQVNLLGEALKAV